MGVVAPRTVDAVERAVSRAGTADELLEAVATEVGKTVPYDGAMWFGVDPATLLAVAPARMEQLDPGYCQQFWHGEFHEQDANLFGDLARGPSPAATLRGVTGDRPLRSARYRDFIQPQGFDDELRAVFRTGDRTWGVAALFREKGHAAFDDDDVALFSAISGTVGGAIRRQAAALLDPPPGLAEAPGLLLFDASGGIVSANDAATRWLSGIHGEGSEADWMAMLTDPNAPDLEAAVPIMPLLSRARAIATGHAGGHARLRLRDRTGRWLVLHASVLGGPNGDSIAVVVEPAKSTDVAPIIIEAYGLTPRERDVVRAIARGLSTPDMANELFLSAHTVRDYIKSVFEKVGVKSRAELVAKLFAEHYVDPFHETLVEIH